MISLLAHSSVRVSCLRSLSSTSAAAASNKILHPSYKTGLKNWRMPSMDEYLPPTESWQEVYDRNNRRNNLKLLGGLAFFGFTVAIGTYFNYLRLPFTPKFVEEVHDSLSPKRFGEEEDESQTAAAAAAAAAALEEVLPDEIQYLLVGAGTSSFAAYRAIKSRDPKAKILIIGEETRIPYMRPPLSKEFWYNDDPKAKSELRFKQWNGRERSVFFEPEQFYTPASELKDRENGGISVVKGLKVIKVDPVGQIALLNNGKTVKYEKCLIATGGQPKNLPVLEELSKKVTLFRSIDDFLKLNKLVEDLKSVTIIGGGFLGSELACALGHKYKEHEGKSVIQIFPEPGILGKILPEYLSTWTMDKVRGEGVSVRPNARVASAFLNSKDQVVLKLEDKSEIITDHVVVAVGIEPDAKFAIDSKLEVDPVYGGYKVNAELEARTNLWVAGDAASFYDVSLGRRRVEHHDHAIVSGKLAGENMTGANQPYTHQSMFWSDLGPDVGFEAIGIIDSSLPTVGVFAKATEKDSPKARRRTTTEDEEESEVKDVVSEAKIVANPEDDDDQNYGKGVIFYLKDDRVVGVLMWNVFNKISIARKIIKENAHYDDLAEVAKLFNIHSED